MLDYWRCFGLGRRELLMKEELSEKGAILVIDDDLLVLKSLKKALEKEGYFVDVARDGYEGILKTKAGFFHLVLCDVRMPGLDGIMTIKHIKEYQDKAGEGRSGFIVITGYTSPDTKHHALQLGVTGYVTKPFDLPKLLASVKHQMEVLLPVEHNPLKEIEALNRRLHGFLEEETRK